MEAAPSDLGQEKKMLHERNLGVYGKKQRSNNRHGHLVLLGDEPRRGVSLAL